MTTKTPMAFLSYVRADDEHEGGRLSQFREMLSHEVRMQTGEEFPIFQDRKDVKWGQNWQQRIDDSLDSVTLLIPVITPGFFKSQACRDELSRFLQREQVLGRSDLVLPLYYVDSRILNDASKRAADALAQAINAHQYADWRELRFDPFTSPVVRRKLADLATQIRDALDGAVSSPPRPVAVVAGAATPAGVSDRSMPVMEAATGRSASPAVKTEPPLLVVDAMHRGDSPTIAGAINKAMPGTRILVRPGLYTEALVIDKPLEILGDGGPGEVVVQDKDAHVIAFRTTMGRIANLTVRQLGGHFHAVDIAQGRLVLEDCAITSRGYTCVGIQDSADPLLRRNCIHDGSNAGVLVYQGGFGTIEDNDISGNLLGIAIGDHGNPVVRRNRISKNTHEAIWITIEGRGTFENNDLTGNAGGAWNIAADCLPNVKRSGNKE